MLYTEMTKSAMDICFEAHADKRDKGGQPYVFHPFHLAEQMDTEEEICVAFLHDVIEDTEWTLEDLALKGFPSSVIEALALMNHDTRVPYLEYVEGLSGNPIAAKVKLADLRHNSTGGRLKELDVKAVKRLQKYLRAQAVLTGGEADIDNMCLRVRRELRGKKGEKLFLEITYEPDGRVRRYALETASPDEADLLPDLRNYLNLLMEKELSYSLI